MTGTMIVSKTNLRSGKRSRIGLAVAFVAALCTWLALAVAPASAATTRLVEGSFNGSGSPGGAFTFGPFGGVGVDNSGGAGDGDLYVGETSYFTTASRVVKFDGSGAYDGVEFDGGETPAGSFGFLNFGTFAIGGLAVDSSGSANAGDVYVSDVVNNVVARFDDEGEFLCQISGTTPATLPEEEAECAGATGSATPAAFTPSGIAVSPVNGDVYVGKFEGGTIYRFNAAGEFVEQIVDSQIVEPTWLAVDSSGNLYVNNGTLSSGNNVVKFDAAGTFDSVLDSSQALGVAVDPATDHVFVYEDGPDRIAEYDEAGALLQTFGHGYEFGGLIGVGESVDSLYVTNFSFAGSSIEIYGPPAVIPDVVAEPASGVEEDAATLNGEVDPAGGGDVESCEFEYGPSTSYGNTVPCAEATPYSGVTSVSAEISGLSPSTQYHYRLVAANANGVDSSSNDEILYTKGAPTVDEQSASGITRFSAEIDATVNPHGFSTDWQVEYVTKAQYEVNEFTDAESTTPVAIGSQLVPQDVGLTVSGLQVETAYYFRVVATNSVGSDTGAPVQFETLPIVDVLDLDPIAENTSVTMRERVNPLGLSTTCQVEYVTDAAFEESEWTGATTVPCDPEDLGDGSKPIQVRTKVTGLSQSATYHSRFVLSNSSGTYRSPDRVFTTFGVKRFSMELLDDEGNPVTQAGSHPYEYVTEFEFNGNSVKNHNKNGSEVQDYGATATLKDIRTELPPGLIGNPNGLPRCPQRMEETFQCPANTQVGGIGVNTVGEGPGPSTKFAPMFNLVPPEGVAAKFGAVINIGISAYIEFGVRTGGDYGVNADSINITSFANASAINLRVWGNPGDPGHTADGLRFCTTGSGYQKGCAPAGLTEKPFLSMPTSCSEEPLTVRGSVSTYQAPNNPVSIETQLPSVESELPGVTGCDAIEFDPGIEVRPTTNVADSPTGLHVDIDLPQNEDEEGLRVSDLRDAKVTLPPGLVLNPAGANGLTGCSPAAFRLHGSGSGNCPDGSKIGTAEVDTPLIGHTLPGSIYVATPFDNPFDSLAAIYVEVNDAESGVILKLAGHVQLDPDTGRITTTFDQNPQLPFDNFRLDFFKGAKAPLRTSAVCGSYKTSSVLTPWSAPDSGPPAEPFDTFDIVQSPGGGGCPSSAAAVPTETSFEAGTASPLAGTYSPFVLHLRREDGSQELENLTVTPPPGLLARLAGTAYCSEGDLAAASGRSGASEQASPSCPAGSEVGTVNVGAGAGPAPYYVQGHAYLAGPYKGAPLSLAVVTPAKAGPYDLGTVVVRVALRVNPETTKITAVSDPLPRILQGIPLDIRSIALELGKPEFTLNPTSCDPAAVDGEVGSTLGQVLHLSNPFQVGNCTDLSFKPKLGMRIFGKTNRGGHPKLRAALKMPAAGANIARAVVSLPRSEFLDQSHIRTICTRVQYAAGGGGGEQCPRGAVYGYARAWSPLLDQPLQGPVFLRSSDHKLPDLVASLRGQIQVDLVGRIDSVRGGIRTSFELVPDAPVSKFVLTMKGGGKGLLQNSTNVCRGKHRVVARFNAQNGATADLRPALINGKCNKRSKKHRAHRRGRAAR